MIAAGIATGKMMTLRARWKGDPPVIGDYLMGSGRVRSAYCIVAIIHLASCLEFQVNRVAPTAIPVGAQVHEWKWDKRSARNGAGWSA